jgi:outer membrane protein assembly factor BamA
MQRTTIVAGLIVCSLLAGNAARAGWGKPPTPALVGVLVEGAEQFSADELKEGASLTVGMSYNADKASADCAAIIRRYQERGYPFVTCSPSLQLHPQIASWGTLIYHIHEGPKVRVQRVEFAGNSFFTGDRLAANLQSHTPGSSETNFAAVQDDVARLAQYYRSFGFLDVAVTYELQWNLDGDGAVMMFHIDEGTRYRLKD